MKRIFLPLIFAAVFLAFILSGTATSAPSPHEPPAKTATWTYPIASGDNPSGRSDETGDGNADRYAPIFKSFEPPAQRWLPGHRGVDFTVGKDAVIISPVDGVITFSGKVFNRHIVTVTSDDGFKNSFEPVRSHLRSNTAVKAGDVIGHFDFEGKAYSHCPPRECIHWGVRDPTNEYRNPLFFLHDRKRSVLLPYLPG